MAKSKKSPRKKAKAKKKQGEFVSLQIFIFSPMPGTGPGSCHPIIGGNKISAAGTSSATPGSGPNSLDKICGVVIRCHDPVPDADWVLNNGTVGTPFGGQMWTITNVTSAQSGNDNKLVVAGKTKAGANGLQVREFYGC